MKAHPRRRQKQTTPPEGSRPAVKLCVADWRERWEEGDYDQLEPWQLAWGLLRHSDDYWYCWAFDIGPRMAGDGSIIPEVPQDSTEWAEKYDLQHAINPSLSAFELTENPFRSTRTNRGIRIYRAPERVHVVLAPNQAMVRMDLSWPIAPQLAAAKRHLRQRKSPRLRLDTYPRYVCALDAKATGASLAAIGTALYPTVDDPETRRDRIKKDLRVARSLSASGYEFIARG